MLSPTLPAPLQSSLLNVGMRVRKSVPEGYKTRPKILCSHSTTNSNSSSESKASTGDHSDATIEFTGLVPYCGIPKIAGHQAQPVPAEDDLLPLQFETDDWNLPPSQESHTSSVCRSTTMATPMPKPISNKRRREDPDDVDDADLQPVSPRSYPVSHTRMPNLDQLRSIAQPKTRRKLFPVSEMKESEMADVGDFEEAEFFRPDNQWRRDWGKLEEM